VATVLQQELRTDAHGRVVACIKAFVPLTREKLTKDDKFFRRGPVQTLREKRIFAAVTAEQVGYVSNVQVHFADEDGFVN
jgi:hypothetical protein